MLAAVGDTSRITFSRAYGLRFMLVSGLVASGASLLYAQPSSLVAPINTPDISAAEQRREQERRQQEEQRLQPRPDVRLPSTESLPSAQRLLGDEAPCFVIQSVVFVGEDAVQFNGLSRSLAGIDGQDSPIGRCIGATDIALLAKRAQDALIAQGYVTSRVLTEPQDVSGGVVQLKVLAGRVSNIRFSEKSLRRPALLNAMPIRSGQILNIRDIEQALENFKRSPLADADIQISPGAAPGESELLIDYKQARIWRLNQNIDDAGSKSTGKYQSATTLNVDSPFGWHDVFYITLNSDIGGIGRDPEPRGSLGGSIFYAIPMGYNLLALTVSKNRYFQTIVGASQNYVYRGTSHNAEFKLSRLVYRDTIHKTTLSFKGFARRSQNFIDDVEVEVQRRTVGGWELGVGQRSAFGDVTLDANVAYKRGTGAFKSLPSPEEAFGEGTSRFALVSADLNLAGRWSAGTQGQHKGRWSSSLRGQTHRTPLTPQDRISIGSRYSVRGFDGTRSLSAESGWFLRNDIGYAIGQGAHELYLGLDHGRVAGPSSAFLAGNKLTGAVIGLRGAFSAANSSAQIPSLSYEFFAGKPIGQPAGFLTRSTALGLNLNISF